MKKQVHAFAPAVITTAAVLAAPAALAGEASANVAAASNYLFRGISQTQNEAAVSGGLDYAFSSGWYVGTWLSNVNFGDGSTELDLYLGFGGESGGVGYDVGYIYYAYPQDEDLDYGEIFGSLSVGPAELGVHYVINSDVVEPGVYVEGDLYYFLSVGGEIAPDWSIAGTIGYQDFDEDGTTGVGDVSYAHYQLDVTRSLGDFGDVTFTLSKADEESGDDDVIPVIAWSKTF